MTPAGDGDWKVKERGAERAVKVLEDKSDALELAKDLAKKANLGQVIIHGKDGVIRQSTPTVKILKRPRDKGTWKK